MENELGLALLLCEKSSQTLAIGRREELTPQFLAEARVGAALGPGAAREAREPSLRHSCGCGVGELRRARRGRLERARKRQDFGARGLSPSSQTQRQILGLVLVVCPQSLSPRYVMGEGSRDSACFSLSEKDAAFGFWISF